MESPVNASPAAQPGDPAEAERIEAARGGDEAAFAALYRDHVGRVHALCLRLLADRALAEDLTQEAFVQAWRRLGSFRGDARFATWLHRLTMNTVITYQRRHGPWLTWLRAAPTAAPEPADPASPASRLDLDAAIARLPQRARQVFVLVDVEGYSHEQAGEALGIAVGTSKAQLHRARQLLRETLS